MSSEAHRRGLLRLLLGAAFVLLGWMLVSATPASADDAVTSVTSVVGGVVEPVTDAVEPVVENEPVRVVETVTEPVVTTVEPAAESAAEAVEKSVAAPVTTATEATREVVETTTEVVGTTTEVVEGAVEATPVAPVVENTVAVASGIVRDTASTLTVDVAGPVVETVNAVVGGTAGTVAAALPVEGVVPGVPVEALGVASGPGEPTTVAAALQAPAEGRAAHGIRLIGPAVPRATSATAETPSSTSVTERATGILRTPLRGPAPTGPQAGALPVPSNASSGGSAGADAASTPQAFILPDASVPAMPDAQQHPAAGPVPDPGSRPD